MSSVPRIPNFTVSRDGSITGPGTMYSPVAVRTADGTEVRVVESFYPRHRATKHLPARSFRFAGRAFTDEDRWSYLRRRPAQHRIPTPLDRSENDRG